MYFIVQGSARIIFPGLCVAAVTCHNKEARTALSLSHSRHTSESESRKKTREPEKQTGEMGFR